MSDVRAICVYGGASPGRDPRFREAAAALGRAIARRGLGLVTGGGSVGLMGVVADAALAESGRVTGVIPEFLCTKELAHEGLTEQVVVASMHERKRTMFERAQAFIVLPGGFGTLDEAFEMITWRQLGRHAYPVVFLDVAGFWDPLLAHFERAIEAGFIAEANRALYAVARTAEEAVEIATGA